MLRVLALAAVANAFNGVKPSVQPTSLAPLRKAAGAAALAVGGLALPLQPAVAGVCSYAPNSDLCVAAASASTRNILCGGGGGEASCTSHSVSASKFLGSTSRSCSAARRHWQPASRSTACWLF